MTVDEAETMENNGPIISNGDLNPDTEHLILPDDDSLIDESLEIQVHIKKPTRSIVIEPLFLLIVASLLPMSLLMGIYVYDRLKKEVAIDYGIPVENISDMHCQEVDMNSTLYLAQERAQDLNARFNIYYSFSYSIPCLITTLFLSGYSDRAGRKYAIVSPAIGFLIYGVINCVILFADLPLWCLFISGFFLGAGGSYQMLLAGCFAYLGDTVESNKIMFRITVIELLAFMLGSLGPLFVGNLIPVIGYSYLCLIFAFMNLLSFLYALFFIPEIIIPTERVSIFSLSHLKSCVDLYTKDTSDGNRRWKLILLIVTFFFIATVNLGNTGIWTLFELGQPLCWTSSHIGDFTAIYVSCGTVVGIILTKTLKMRLEDEQICFISGLSGIGHYTYQVFVKTSIMMYFAPAIGVADRLFIPGLRAVMSTLVLPSEQGAVFGSIAILEVICDLAGSASFNAIYDHTLDISSGFVFSIMAGCYVIGTVLIGIYNIKTRKEKRQKENLKKQKLLTGMVEEED